MHRSLEARGLLPGEHLVDKGYTDSHVLVDSPHRFGVTITGPVADDPSWQARLDDGLTKADFGVDWERRVAICPAGNESVSWLPAARLDEGMAFEVRFGRKDCTPCPLRPRCTQAKREPRIIWLQARERFEALQWARKHQKTAAFRESYAARAGIERGHACPGHQPLRPAPVPVRRPRQTRLQHVIAATAINLVWVAEWFAGTPVARTRLSCFAALQAA